MKFKKVIAGLLTVALIGNTSVGAIDFKSESNVTSQALENSLYYNLKDLSDTFIECEEKYGVNAIALASIAAVESGWGNSKLAENKNNLFGWRKSSGSYMSFTSKSECIEYVAKSLSENYLDENGKYYSGGTRTANIALRYSESETWKDTVNEVAKQIENRCSEYEELETEMICPS